MAKLSYSEQLRHPNWQRLRLEILQRDAFTCRKCGATEKSLNVHHLYYDKTALPWEYPATSLIALCEDCHQDEHEHKWAWDQSLIFTLRSIGALNEHIIDLALAVSHGAEPSDSRQQTDAEWKAIARAVEALFRCTQTGGTVSEIADELEKRFPRMEPK